MSEIIIVNILTNVPPLVLAIATLIIGLRIHKSVIIYHHQVNSRLDEIIELAEKVARAEGRLAGHAEGLLAAKEDYAKRRNWISKIEEEKD